jgi:hypothetical protein
MNFLHKFPSEPRNLIALKFNDPVPRKRGNAAPGEKPGLHAHFLERTAPKKMPVHENPAPAASRFS